MGQSPYEDRADRLADEEGNAKIVLQLADLSAQERLRDVQFLRGLAEVEVFRYCEKVANMS